MLAGGANSHDSIGKQFNLSHDSVRRHWSHVDEKKKVALKFGPVKMALLAARAAEESTSVLDGYKAVATALWHFYDQALSNQDAGLCAMLAGRIHENLRDVSRLTGELTNSPLITHSTTINNNLTLAQSEEFEQLRSNLVRVLSAFPDALRAVIAEFNREPLPALEHEPIATAHAEIAS